MKCKRCNADVPREHWPAPGTARSFGAWCEKCLREYPQTFPVGIPRPEAARNQEGTA